MIGSRAQRPVGGAVGSVALWVYAVGALVPLVLMVTSSFRTNADLITDPLGAPWPLSTESYTTAWTDGNFATYFGNSLLVTAGAVLRVTAPLGPIDYTLGMQLSALAWGGAFVGFLLFYGPILFSPRVGEAR